MPSASLQLFTAFHSPLPQPPPPLPTTTHAPAHAHALPATCIQIQYVSNCLTYQHLKSAARAVVEWELRPEFPDVEAQYKRRTLARLAGKGLWGVAATYVGEDAALQVGGVGQGSSVSLHCG